MADVRKTVEVTINVTGANKAQLENIANNFNIIANAVQSVSAKLTALKSDLGSFESSKGITDIVNNVKKFENIKVPNIKQIAQGFERFSKIKSPPDLGKFADEAKKFGNIKVPNINSLSKGIEKLADASLNMQLAGRRLRIIHRNMKRLSEVKPPNLTSFVNGLKKLISLDIGAISDKIKRLVSSITQLSKSGNLSHFAKFAADLRAVAHAASFSKEKMKSFRQLVEQTGKTVQQLNIRMRGFSGRISNYLQYRVAADAVLGIQDAVRGTKDAVIEYDQALKNLQAIMQATDTEVTQMGAAIEKVASITKFSATEVAEGMQILGQSGLSAGEAINAIQAVSDLATGTLTDMQTAVDLVTTALRVFDIASEDSVRIADVFANAVNKSKLTIDKLRIAMNYVGPIAASAGTSLEETAAAMMVLANSGQRASTIGTGLRRMFAELVDPSAKMKAAADKVGVSLASLDPTSNELTDVLRNLSYVITDVDVAFDLFGKRGAAAALSLTKNISGGFDSMLEDVGRFGTASAMAEKQMEGLGVSFKNLKDKLKLIGVAIGKAGLIPLMKLFADSLRDLADLIVWLINNVIAPLIDALSPVFRLFQELPRPIKSSIVVIASLSAVLAALGKSMLFVKGIGFISTLFSTGTAAATAAGGVTTLTGALAGLRAILTFLTGPIGLVITGITALGTAIVLLSENSEKQIESFERLRNELNATKNNVNSFIQELGKLEGKGIDFLSTTEGKEEMLSYMDRLVQKFPELTDEVYATGGNIEALNTVLKEFKEHIDDIKFESAMEGLDGYATKLERLYNRLENLNTKTPWLIFDKDKHAKKIRDTEKEIKTIINNMAAIVNEAKEKGKTIDWAEMFNVYEFELEDRDSTVFYLMNKVLTKADEMREGIKKVRFGEAFDIYGIAGKWKKEFDEAGTELQKFLDDNFEKNERYNKLIDNIDRAKIQKFVDRQRELQEKIAEIDSLQGDEKLAALRKLRQESAALNAEIAKDEQASRIIRYNNLVKWERKTTAERLKHLDDERAILQEKLAIYSDGQKQLEKALRQSVDSSAIFADMEANNAEIEARNREHIENINLLVQQGVISHEAAEVRKMQASIKTYEVMLASAEAVKKIYDEMGSLALESEEYEKVVKLIQKLTTKLETTRIKKAIAGSNARIANLKRENKKLADETALGIAEINKRVAQKQLSHEAADAQIRKRQIALIDAQIANYRILYEARYKGNKENIKAIELMSEINRLKVRRIDLETAEAQAIQDVIEETKRLNEAQIKQELEYQKAKLSLNIGISPGIEAEYERAALIADINNKIAQQEVQIAKDKWDEKVRIAGEGSNEALSAALEYYDAVHNMEITELEGTRAVVSEKVQLLEWQWRRGLASAQQYYAAIVEAEEMGVISYQEAMDRKISAETSFWAAFKAGAVRYKAEIKSMGEHAAELGSVLTDSLYNETANALTAIVTRIKSVKDAFKDLARSVLQDISRIIAKMMVLQLFGGPGAGGGFLKIFGFADGGMIPGFSPHPKADNIPIMATAGEFMQPVSAVRYYGKNFMESIRSLRFPKSIALDASSVSSVIANRSGRFADGGLVGASSPVHVQTGDTKLKIVNVLDQNLLSSYLDTVDGEFSMINFITKNKSTIQSILR